IGLIAGTFPLHAEIAPVRRPPAVPPLAAPAPSAPQSDPVAEKRDAEAQSSDIVLKTLARSIGFATPVPGPFALTVSRDKRKASTQIAEAAQAQQADTVAIKRDAEAKALADIALKITAHPIEFGRPVPIQIALKEAPEVA